MNEFTGHLWKDEYKIGEKTVDAQHYQLFFNVEKLLYIIRNHDALRQKKECESIINFLLEYTVQHFADEERLQLETGYVSYELHKKIHADFTNTVLLYKKRLDEAYSEEELEHFTGTLLSWLVFHVLGCDSKIPKNEPIGSSLVFGNAEDSMRSVAQAILTGLYKIEIKESKSCMYKGFIEGDCFIRTIVKGSKNYLIIYGISKKLAVEVFRRMAGIDLSYMDEPDDLAKSAFLELGNIFSTYIIGAMTEDSTMAYTVTHELFIGKYDDKTYKTNNNILLDVNTVCGDMEILLTCMN